MFWLDKDFFTQRMNILIRDIDYLDEWVFMDNTYQKIKLCNHQYEELSPHKYWLLNLSHLSS